MLFDGFLEISPAYVDRGEVAPSTKGVIFRLGFQEFVKFAFRSRQVVLELKDAAFEKEIVITFGV